jgi:MFS family permease
MTSEAHGASKTKALRFVVLMGAVSLFADMTYEGARSVTGPFLGSLGASGMAVGVVAGLGELIGYGLRLVSGYLSDRTRRYWAITITGYVINLFAVPCLALADRWDIAAALIITERLGKAIRTPSRDTLLSYATQELGSGWAFGLHEALDQAGAMVGPLIVAGVLMMKGTYQAGFAALLVPALLAVALLLTARVLYPSPRDLETSSERSPSAFPRFFWIYLGGVSLIASGYADYPLVAYHFGKVSSVPRDWIPVFYSVAMGVDALAALVFGYLFDRRGFGILIVSALISAAFAPFVFFGGFWLALSGVVLWGIGMGAQESIMRAAIAKMIPADRRGTAYGVFNTVYGIFWFAGSALMGYLYDISIPALVLFSVAAQLLSVPLLWIVKRQWAIRPA